MQERLTTAEDEECSINRNRAKYRSRHGLRVIRIIYLPAHEFVFCFEKAADDAEDYDCEEGDYGTGPSIAGGDYGLHCESNLERFCR